MRKRFLAFFLATSLCLGSSMTVFAAEATSVATSTTSYDTGQRQVAYETSATRLQLDTIRSLFNAKEYAAMYPDVVKELGNNEEALWNHFVTYGFSEGRSMNKNFNVFAYRACYEDLQKAFGNDLFEEGKTGYYSDNETWIDFTLYDNYWTGKTFSNGSSVKYALDGTISFDDNGVCTRITDVGGLE